MIKIEDIKVTQDGYRLSKEVRDAMLDFVASGGRYNAKSLQEHDNNRGSLIAVTRFPDGELYLRDGLHRVTSIFIARPKKVLYDEEFFFEDMTYEMYINPEPEKGWYTPFDPRIEVRLPDFNNFKIGVTELHATGNIELVIEYIIENKHQYAVARDESHSIKSLSKMWVEKSEALI